MPLLATGRALLDPERFLRRAGLGSNMVCVDLRPGNLGHVCFSAARIVGPRGHVYAVELLPRAVEALVSRARHESANHVDILWGDMEHSEGLTDVPAGCAHVVSLVDASHVLLRTESVLRRVTRLLRPDGVLVLVGWKPSATLFSVPVSRRVAPADLLPFIERAGLVQTDSFNAGPHHWAMVFARG